MASKCYCIISYYPYFELHYALLNTVLSIRRVKRIAKMNEMFMSTMSNSNPALMPVMFDVCEEVESLLTTFKEYKLKRSIQIDSMELVNPLNYILPPKDWEADVIWH